MAWGYPDRTHLSCTFPGSGQWRETFQLLGGPVTLLLQLREDQRESVVFKDIGIPLSGHRHEVVVPSIKQTRTLLDL